MRPRRARDEKPKVSAFLNARIDKILALQPDCVLIEGPPEGDSLLPLVVHSGMQPPVALLGHCPDEARLAVYHPYALRSPERQARRWAAAAGVPGALVVFAPGVLLKLPPPKKIVLFEWLQKISFWAELV